MAFSIKLPSTSTNLFFPCSYSISSNTGRITYTKAFIHLFIFLLLTSVLSFPVFKTAGYNTPQANLKLRAMPRLEPTLRLLLERWILSNGKLVGYSRINSHSAATGSIACARPESSSRRPARRRAGSRRPPAGRASASAIRSCRSL